MTPPRTLMLLAAVLGGVLALPHRVRADDTGQNAAVCGACHGQQGVPLQADIPVIWGQNEGYLYLELRDFKLGNRKSPIMEAIAAPLEKQDMRDLAALFAAKPWPGLNQPVAPADVAQHAETVNSSAGCRGCHLGNWQGDSTTPRVAGQQLGYLRATMAAFRDGARTNNPWMAALLKTFSDADIDALARYLAGM